MNDNKTIYADFAKAIGNIIDEAWHMKVYYGDSAKYLFEPKCLCDMFAEEGTSRFIDTLDYYYPLLNDFLKESNGYMPQSIMELWEVLVSIEYDADIAKETMAMDVDNCYLVLEQYDKETGKTISQEPKFTHVKHYKALEKIQEHAKQWHWVLSGYYGEVVRLKHDEKLCAMQPTATTQPQGGTDEITLPDTKEIPTEPKNRGRKSRPFIDCVIGDKDTKARTMKCLEELIKGKVGRAVALIIYTAIDMGLITKPTFPQVQKQFGDIGNDSGYNKYIKGNLFDKNEIEGIKKRLQ